MACHHQIGQFFRCCGSRHFSQYSLLRGALAAKQSNVASRKKKDSEKTEGTGCQPSDVPIFKRRSPQFRYPKKGVNPAYDEAMKFLKETAQSISKQISEEENRLFLLKESVPSDPEKIKLMIDIEKRLENLYILKDKDNPEIIWKFSKGYVNLERPIYRHLLEEKWTMRALPILMQRLETMNVIPDTLPSIKPRVNVRLRFPDEICDTEDGWMEPGVFVTTKVAERIPIVEIIPFVTGLKNYTICLIDPDSPDTENDSFTTYLHWLVTDIPITHVTHQVDLSKSTVQLPYIPPHPYKGMKYHRYTLFVFEQNPSIVLPEMPLPSRERFNIRSFVAKRGLKAAGAHMFRSVFDDNVPFIVQKHNLDWMSFERQMA